MKPCLLAYISTFVLFAFTSSRVIGEERFFRETPFELTYDSGISPLPVSANYTSMNEFLGKSKLEVIKKFGQPVIKNELSDAARKILDPNGEFIDSWVYKSIFSDYPLMDYFIVDSRKATTVFFFKDVVKSFSEPAIAALKDGFQIPEILFPSRNFELNVLPRTIYFSWKPTVSIDVPIQIEGEVEVFRYTENSRIEDWERAFHFNSSIPIFPCELGGAGNYRWRIRITSSQSSGPWSEWATFKSLK